MELSPRSERDHTVALLAVEDEQVASQSPARLLITASTQQGVETIARRVHGAGPRAQFPFVQTWAADFPVAPQALREYCDGILDVATGGSMLINAVEETPPTIQDALNELLAGLAFTHQSPTPVRLISGTTVSLLDRVAAGTFSAQLFYRLNVVHLIACDSPIYVAGATTRRRCP